jgi:type I restriction enzyme R subunit
LYEDLSEAKAVCGREIWLEIIGRFLHLERDDEGRERLIFPRYHQLDTVRRLLAHARTHGPGQNYLIQHSAGSGKSNTIGWLAHQAITLHDEHDRQVFDTAIVVTDRLVLDSQLQATVAQFEQTPGVVKKIDGTSAQLRAALAGGARIVVTTVQKFGTEHLRTLAGQKGRRFALLIDEAHSSQSGKSAQALTDALTREATSSEDVEDIVLAYQAARGPQPTISYIGLTATPRQVTLERFGVKEADGLPRPFHLYSMRQAIEEGFILDVLANYTTYRTFYRVEKAIRDDPEYDPARAKHAIARFVTLHPHNLAQRAEIVIEHFREHTRKKIGRRAKAMVVTSSRLHAVRTKLALDAYIAEKGYTDVRTLVAFSGTVVDQGDDFTEPRMNRFPESETARQFGGDDYQVLVVAEKFQTGFDQPLLHTMYVDKVLTGLNAVQTLSRLNRIHPQKTDTFVLDFRNELDEIQEAFRPYYERTDAVPTDPNLLYDTHRAMLDFGVLREEEVEEGVAALLAVSETAGHGAVYAALDAARERFRELEEEVQDAFRDVLARFVNMYAFVSQIVSYVDRELERDYLYARALLAYLPGLAAERLDLGSEVELTHLKLAQTFEGSGSLEEGGGEVVAIFSGRGKEHDLEKEHLSRIVEVINERYGLELGDADQHLFDQFEETWAADEALAARARGNTFENFRLVFDREFIETVVKRMDSNAEIFKRILDDADFQRTVLDYYAARLYERLRSDVDQLGLTPA